MNEDFRHDHTTGAVEDAYVLPLRELLLILWRRSWIIILMIIVFTAAAIGLSLMQQPVYEASIRVLVGQKRGIPENPTDVSGLQDLTKTIAEAAESRPLAEQAIQLTGLQISPETFLDERLSASQIVETQFVEISYQGTNPQKTQEVANTFGDLFSERVSEVNSNNNPITVTVWEPAAVPSQPISPNPLRNGLIAAMLGTVLGVGLAFLLEYLSDRWRSPEELERLSGTPVFGIIPEFEVSKGDKKGKA